MTATPTIWTFEAIGVPWNVELFTVPATCNLEQLFTQLQTRIAAYDHLYSRFREDSWVSQLAKTGGSTPLPGDATPLFTLYQTLYELTEGRFTPFIGDALVAAGYDAQYSLIGTTITHPPRWEDVLTITADTVTLTQPVLLDFGAGGKGYLIDIIGNLLRKSGVTSFCIDASGDILASNLSNAPQRIGLEHPLNPQQVIGVAQLTHGSLCASAGNRRTWGKYHHIIDPNTLESPRSILATWVVAETALLADALATALFLVPPKVLAEQFAFEYGVLHDTLAIETSKHFPAELFIQYTKKAL